MSIPSALIDCLNANKIPFEVLPHAQAFTARMAAAAEHIASHHQAKVVMVNSPVGSVMTVLPADRKLDLRKLKRVIHEPVALQSEAEFAPAFADCEPGAMPPFGNLYGLPTYVDEHLTHEDYMVGWICHWSLHSNFIQLQSSMLWTSCLWQRNTFQDSNYVLNAIDAAWPSPRSKHRWWHSCSRDFTWSTRPLAA